MRRWWGIASVLSSVLAAPAVNAEPDATATTAAATDAEPASTAPAQAVVYGAMPGGIHVATAETLAKGIAEISTLSGFGRRTGLLGSEHKFNRAIGDIAFAYGVTDMITVGLSLEIEIRGATLPGWTAKYDVNELPVDSKNRFHATVPAPPEAKALAIRLSHPKLGTHFYLRRGEKS